MHPRDRRRECLAERKVTRRGTGSDLVEQMEYARAPLSRVIKANVELGYPLDPKSPSELVAHERHRMRESGHRSVALGGLADHAHPDAGVTKVRSRLDPGDGGEADTWIGDVLDDHPADLLAQELVDPVGPLTHDVTSCRRLGRLGGGQPPRPRLTHRDPADRLRRVALDDVAFLDNVEVGEPDAALVVGEHLADVIAEPAERLDPVGCDHLAATPDACPASDDPSVGDERTGDHRVLADADDLTDFGTSLDDLDDLGFEQALKGRVDVVGQLVDDVIETDVDAFGLRCAPRRLSDARAEPDHDRVGRRGEHAVVVRDVAGGGMEDVDANLVLVKLLQGMRDGSERS